MRLRRRTIAPHMTSANVPVVAAAAWADAEAGTGRMADPREGAVESLLVGAWGYGTVGTWPASSCASRAALSPASCVGSSLGLKVLLGAVPPLGVVVDDPEPELPELVEELELEDPLVAACETR